MTARQALAGASFLLAGFLASLVCAAGLIGFAYHHIPVVMRDVIDIQYPLMHGKPVGPYILQTHVDHILAFQRLLSWMDVRWLNGGQWFSLSANLLACAGLALLTVWSARRSGLAVAAAWLAGLAMLAGLLWLANGFNIFWGMQAHFFMAPFFTLASGLLLALQPARLAAAFLLAALGAVTSGSGIVGLIALALVAAVLRLPGRQRLLVPMGFLLLLVAVLWLRSFTHDFYRRNPLPWLDEPLLVLDYLRLYLANPARLALRPLLPVFQSNMFAGIALGLVSLALAWSWVRLLRAGARPTPLATAGQVLCLTAIGSGLVTALMRLNAGLATAEAERYITTQTLFGIGIVLLGFEAAARARPAWRTAGLAALAALLGLLVAGLPHHWRQNEYLRSAYMQASAAIISGSQDGEPWGRFHPMRPHLQRTFDFMRAERIGFFDWPEADWIGAPAATLGRADPGCSEPIFWLRHRITRDDNVALVAWLRADTAPEAILLLDAEDRIALFSWPSAGVRRGVRPAELPDRGVELWLTREQLQSLRFVSLRDGRLCEIVPQPGPAG